VAEVPSKQVLTLAGLRSWLRVLRLPNHLDYFRVCVSKTYILIEDMSSAALIDSYNKQVSQENVIVFNLDFTKYFRENLFETMIMIASGIAAVYLMTNSYTILGIGQFAVVGLVLYLQYIQRERKQSLSWPPISSKCPNGYIEVKDSGGIMECVKIGSEERYAPSGDTRVQQCENVRRQGIYWDQC
jgi:hypothetical protein